MLSLFVVISCLCAAGCPSAVDALRHLRHRQEPESLHLPRWAYMGLLRTLRQFWRILRALVLALRQAPASRAQALHRLDVGADLAGRYQLSAVQTGLESRKAVKCFIRCRGD